MIPSTEARSPDAASRARRGLNSPVADPLAQKLVLSLGAIGLELLAIVVWLLCLNGPDRFLPAREEVMRDRVRELVSSAGGIFDSHPDPDIGRLLMPNLAGRSDFDVPVHSNQFGVREASYQLPKPKEVLRVVLLGDSMVYGYKVPEEKRFGVHLAESLAPFAKKIGKSVECLHLGITAWNLRAECAFLRRQLSLLQPDVVLHFTVRNDLDDNPSLRGFGALADFTDQFRGHADGTITDIHPRFLGAGPASLSPLFAALDFEGKSRLESAARDVERLRDAVNARGGRYVLILVDPARMPMVLRHFGEVLAAEEIACIPALGADMRLAPNDLHWNVRGMRRVAQYCYGLLRTRNLLNALDLPPSPGSDDLFSRLDFQAEREARESRVQEKLEEQLGRSITFDGPDSEGERLSQVHGGVVGPGVVLPYASMILRNDAATQLVVEGSFLDRPELRGGSVAIFVDDQQVGRLDLGSASSPAVPFSMSFAVPGRLQCRRYVSIRFIADDWALDGENLRRCACFRLRRVALQE